MEVALFQARTGIDPARNAARIAQACGDAAAGGASMLFTPEMSGLLDRDSGRARLHAVEEERDLVLRATREAAREHGIWVQLGSLAVAVPGGRLANRAFLIDDQGEVRARYDKMHLFDVDLPSGETWRESARYVAGNAEVVAETPWGRIGMSICYDLRFAALYASLAAAGATLFSIPAAFTVETGRAHWHTLLRARAIESGAFVVAAAQCGHHEDGRETFGHSLVVDPWGRVLLDMGEEDDALGFAEVDPALVGQARTAIPALRHRREIGAARVYA